MEMTTVPNVEHNPLSTTGGQEEDGVTTSSESLTTQNSGPLRDVTVTDTALTVTQSIGDTLLSADVFLESAYVIDWMIYILQAMGVVLNVLNIVVMTRPAMRNPTTTYLVALSALQLLYIAVILFEAFYRLTPNSYTSQDLVYLVYGFHVKSFGMSCLRRYIYALLLLVSLERLLAVAWPLRARGFLLVRRPLVFILVAPVVIVLMHIPLALKIEIFQTSTTASNGTAYSYRPSQLYQQDPLLFDALGMATKVVFVYVALLLLLISNGAMLLALRRQARQRKALAANTAQTSAQRRESQLTLTILVSTFIFVALNLPTVSNSMVFNAMPESYGPFTQHRFLFLFVQKFGSLCLVLALCSDFFVYLLISSAFRGVLLGLLRIKMKTKKKKNPESSGSIAAVSRPCTSDTIL